MKLNIAYWSKRNILCPNCKSDKLVIIFFKTNILSNILNAAQQGRIKLSSSDVPNKELQWLCKTCYDVGEMMIV